jgi:hypothetical protein
LDQIAALSDTSTDRQRASQRLDGHDREDTGRYDSAWDFLNDCGLKP